MTNRDKIQQMSDEEFVDFMDQDFCPYEHCIDLDSASCYDCLLNWIREEAQEDG